MRKAAFIIFALVIALITVGLVMVLTASSTFSIIFTESVFHFFNSHLSKVFLAVFFMCVFAFLPYDIYRHFSKIGMILALALLLITPFVAENTKGAMRWINLYLFTIQPADIAKLFIIIHLARLIEAKGKEIEELKYGFLPPLIWIVLFSGLIIIQPNVSNAVLIILISFSILYVGGARLKHLFLSSLTLIAAGGAMAMILPHSRSRILTFFTSMTQGGDINLQVKQGIIALGSGGMWGVGIGHSRQSDLFIPEAYGDFIFTVLGEEVGFVGSAIVLFVYLVLFISGILVAKNAKDEFGKLLAFGITFLISISAFINVGVTSGLLPTTGLPLPFISYGGSSMLATYFSIGMVLSVSISKKPSLFS